MSLPLLLFLLASSYCSALITSPSLWKGHGGHACSFTGRRSPYLPGSTTNTSPIASGGAMFATNTPRMQGRTFLTPEVCRNWAVTHTEARGPVSQLFTVQFIAFHVNAKHLRYLFLDSYTNDRQQRRFALWLAPLHMCMTCRQ